MRLYREEKSDVVQRLFDLREANLNTYNELEKAYYYLDKAGFTIGKDPSLAMNYLERVDAKTLEASDSLKVSYYQIRGQYYYMRVQFDSAFLELKQGYNAAMELGDTLSMGRIAIGLGGMQSILGYDQSAIEYLMRALELDPENLVLANNLGSVLTGQRQYFKAKEILDKHVAVLQSSNLDLEEIMFKLTYIHLLQEMGKWEEAKEILNKLSLKIVGPAQEFNYHCFVILQKAHENSGDLNAYLDRIIDTLGKSGYSELFYNLSDWDDRMPLKTYYSHVKSNIQQIDTSILGSLSFSVYYRLLAEMTEAEGRQIQAANLRSRSAESMKASLQSLLKSKDVDLVNRLDLFKLERKYAQSKLQSENYRLTSKRRDLIQIFLLILLAMITFFWYRQHRLNKDNQELNQGLIEQKQKELQILERERETSKKLIELSARILETSKNLKSKLSYLPEKNSAGIRETLEELDYILFLDKSIDTTVLSSGYDFEKIDFLKGMIESQRNVLSLSLDNYRPKEIGVTLNLSYSYVRNVQSRLRKLLKDHGYETFEDLKRDLES